MHVLVTLVVIGLVVFFFIRNSRAGAAVSAVRRAQVRVGAGADQTETLEELIAEFEGVAAVAALPREASPTAVARAVEAAEVPAVVRKSKKQKKAVRDTTERPRRTLHGAIEALQPLEPLAPLAPGSPLRKMRAPSIKDPLGSVDVPAVYAARS